MSSKKQKTETGALDLFVNTKLFTVATCNLNQWAMDFTGNLKRIEESIRVAKACGARYRCGPELEVSGYGCEDHFHEGDTVLHCWQSIASLLSGDLTDGILCDIGMPMIHKNVRYNCRIFILDRKILHLRPKMCMADDGNYRETRWFTEWNAGRGLEEHALPGMVAAVCGQRTVPIGIAAIAVADTVVGSETCEEVFTPNSPHIALALDGVETISNSLDPTPDSNANAHPNPNPPPPPPPPPHPHLSPSPFTLTLTLGLSLALAPTLTRYMFAFDMDNRK